MPSRSDRYHLLDQKLPGGIETFVTERRDKGRSWEKIARDIYIATEWEISHAALARWFTDENGNEAA